VFFDDPISGIHWELAHIPRIARPLACWWWRKALKSALADHPEWRHNPAAAAMRRLPGHP